MAKKNKKDKRESKAPSAENDEEFVFTPPSFDEKEFYHKEIQSFKLTAISFFLGIVGGLVGSVITYFFGISIGFAVAALMGALLVAIPRLLNIELVKLKWGSWLGNSLLYVITIMAVMAVATNPPFMDLTPPTVTSAQWSIDGGANWTSFNKPVYVGDNTSVTLDIKVRAIDNADHDLEVYAKAGNQAERPMENTDSVYFVLKNVTLTPGEHDVIITTVDRSPDVIFSHPDGFHEYTRTLRIEVRQGTEE